MSTLTSSPSPAASPHTAFHVQKQSAFAPSPSTTNTATKASPRLPFPPSPSPRRAFHAPAAPPPSQPYNTTASTPKPPTEHPRPDRAAPPTSAPRYADHGTQYSPPGSPPTSIRSKLAGSNIARAPPTGVVRKRRDSAPSPRPMSRPSSATSPTQRTTAAIPPPEPEPRRDPSRPTTTASTPNPAPTHPTSPQEARSTHGHSSAPKRSRPSPGATKLMPALYQDASAKDLGILISNMLLELIRLNDRIPLRDGRLTRFHSRAPPGISVTDYLQRLIHHATLSPPILLSMVWYIDRLCQHYPAFTINSLTVHRFLITVACVAAKGLSDSFWTNPTYARIGGIPVSELASLELEFLQQVAWRIVPRPEMLVEYYRSLVERTEGYGLEGKEEMGGSTRSTSSQDGSAGEMSNAEGEGMAGIEVAGGAENT